MTHRCGAIYVELGDQPGQDRLIQCDRWPCEHHQAQLDWVHRDLARFMAYVEQMRRFHDGLAPVDHDVLELL